MKKIITVLMFALLISIPAFAQQVEEAATIPSGIGNSDYQFLLEQKKHLDETRDTLVKDISTFNSDCEKVASSDTVKMEDCTKRQELIMARVDTYNRDLVRYQESIQRAQAKAPKIVGFEKGDKNSAPVSTNLQFKAPDSQPLELSKDEKAELKDTPGDIQAKLSAIQDKIFIKAKGQAAWNLGFYLVDQGKNNEALEYFKEARACFDDNSAEAVMLDNAIRDVKQLAPTSKQYPVYKNHTAILLDALQYGNRDWEASYRYLQVASNANPNDADVRKALDYFVPLYESEKGKDKGISLGQIKPRK